MTVDYTLEPVDVLNHSNEASTKTKEHNFNVTFLVIISMLFIFGDVMLRVIQGGFFSEESPKSFIYLLIRILVTGIIFGAVYFALKLLAKEKLNELDHSEEMNGVFCNHKLTIDQKGFTEETMVNKSFQSWKGVERIEETPGFIAIYVRMSSGHIIPKRAFADKDAAFLFFKTAKSFLKASNETKG